MAEKKTVKMYTTKAGAKQSGSKEDIKKHAKQAWYRFISNPTDKNLQVLSTFSAADYAETARKFRELGFDDKENVYDKLEKSQMTSAQKAKARSLLKAKK